MNDMHRKVKARVIFTGVVIVAAFLAVVARMYGLQVEDHLFYFEKAQAQTVGSVVIQPRRGTIYDRKMDELAVNRKVDSIFVNPRLLEDKEQAKLVMRAFLGRTDPVVEKRIDSNLYFVWLMRRMAEGEGDRFRKTVFEVTRQAEITGLGLMQEDRRTYPLGSLAAPILGYTDIEMYGKMGVEYAMDEDLRGENYEATGIRTPGGNVATARPDDSLEVPMGRHVVLTLDRGFQYLAEKALKKAVTDNDAGFGIAVGMDPATGEILLMAQYPAFDANRMMPEDTLKAHNLVLEQPFEPGSTIKVFTISSALEYGVVKPETTIYCEDGAYKMGSVTVHDTKPHGVLSLHDILVLSSNIGSGKIADMMGMEPFDFALRSFGFGERTGIELTGESPGLLRRPTKYNKVNQVILGFGQGLNITGLQLVRAVAAIANDGVMVRPTIIKDILEPDLTPTDYRATHKPENVRILSIETAERMKAMMTDVTRPPGTGVKAAIPGYSVGGKTGTAQKVDPEDGSYSKELWTSSFIGFVPGKKPILALVVVIDEPKAGQYYGGAVAAPVAGRWSGRMKWPGSSVITWS